MALFAEGGVESSEDTCSDGKQSAQFKAGGQVLQSKIKLNAISEEIANAFDYEFTGDHQFVVPEFIVPALFSIGLIVGPSGSGKTSILKTMGGVSSHNGWQEGIPICSHFKTADNARSLFGATGLNSVPAMLREYKHLSNGEQFRADLARLIRSGARIDEFTSVVDRQVAKSCSWAVQRHIRNNGLNNVVFSSCHYDIIDWLCPDWVFDTSTGVLTNRGLLRRPDIEVELYEAGVNEWKMFSSHHYLGHNINKSSRCWVAVWDGKAIGFTSILAFPNGNFKNAWRGHRTVVLPDYQGLGIGVRISDAIGEIIINAGGRYFSKTSNYRMGGYRENSSSWRPTTKNRLARKDYNSGRATKESGHKHRHASRVCFCHEYIGINKAQIIAATA
jgi:GNAT superfamily N-acetyltransferase